MERKYLWHIIGWTLFIIQDLQPDLMEEEWDWKIISLILSHQVVIIATFYFAYSFLCTRLLKFGYLKFILLAIPAGVLFYISIRYLLQEVVFPATLGYGNYYIKDLKFYALDNIWRGLVYSVAGVLVYLLESKNQSDRERSELLQEKKESELAFLRAQLNPHFLFNTMSFLHTQAYMVDEKLADTILKLSDVLRYSVESTNAEKRTVKEEITLLENYIDIFRKRFEGQCFINFKATGTEVHQKVEPLLLMPFVENAFKHGVYTDPENPIEVELSVSKGQVQFSCENLVKKQQKDPGSGIGIENIKRRLELLYPEKYDLQIDEKESTFKVNLILEL